MQQPKPLFLSVLTVAAITGTGLVMPAHATDAVALPKADIVDVDFSNGRATDLSPSRHIYTTFDSPKVSYDPVTGRNTASFNGTSDAFLYNIDAQYEDARLTDGMTVECIFKYDGDLVSGEKNICSNKQAGGFTVAVNGDVLSFQVQDGKSYKSAKTTSEKNKWYHVIGKFDGTSVQLYVNGQKVATTATAGLMQVPTEGARNFVIGGDSKTGGTVEFYAPVTVSAARVYSEVLGDEQIQALSSSFWATTEVPAADLLDVDFSQGTGEAQPGASLPMTRYGKPAVKDDTALNKKVASFDGVRDSFGYSIAGLQDKISESFTLECNFKFTGTEAQFATGEKNICGAKESGGFALAIYNGKLTFTVHTGTGYRQAAASEAIEPGRWYNAVGVFNNGSVELYVDGKLVKRTTGSATPMNWTPNAKAHYIAASADAANGAPGFHAASDISHIRLFDAALTANQAKALSTKFHGGINSVVSVESSTPAPNAHITKPVELDIKFSNPDALSLDKLDITLDGKKVALGETIGSGLKSGTHTVLVKAKTVTGDDYVHQWAFTTPNIAVAGGTSVAQKGGSVELAAQVTNPSGGDVQTTFYSADVNAGTGVVQGVVEKLPTTLEFTHAQGSPISGEAVAGDEQSIESATTRSEDGIPFQRFDVAAKDDAATQILRWVGQVDPQRTAKIYGWNHVTSKWQLLVQERGSSEGNVTLSAQFSPALVKQGAINVLVTVEDPFADDIAKEVNNSFDDPSSYDFALAHLTDTQYLSQGAARANFTDEERSVWREAYAGVPEWIVENAKERKIAYTAHTGDIIESWHAANYADEAAQKVVAEREFVEASALQKILDDAGMPNGVLPGNHDNRTGTHNGENSLYNQYFGASRYEALEQTEAWQKAGVTYESWKPGTNDNDNHYDLFSAGGLDFIALYHGFEVDQEEIAWANDVLATYKDRNAILLTHAYNKPSKNPDGRGAAFSNDGNRLHNGVLEKNKNVFLVLSGHEHGVSIEVKKDVGAAGNNVVELLADYQFYEVKAEELGLAGIGTNTAESLLRFGSSFFRLLQFDVDRSELSIDTYSPFLDNFNATEYDDELRYNGTEDDTRIPIQLETRKTSFASDGIAVVTPSEREISTVTTRSGWPATATWSGLKDGETYGWFAHSTDAQSGSELPAVTSQYAVFTANAAGTDKEAPVLSLPNAATTIKVGDTFDPLAGVTAEDNSDKDVTGLIQVQGSVDAAVPGVYTLTYSVADSNGNSALGVRVVTVEKETVVAPAATVTVMSGVASVQSGKPASITVKASAGSKAIEGKIELRAGNLVIGRQELSQGKTTFEVRDLPVGTHTLTAVFVGKSDYAQSTDTHKLVVTKGSASLAAKVDRTIFGETTVTVAVQGKTTGTVVAKVGKKTVGTGTIKNGKAVVKMPKLTAGSHKVAFTTAGDKNVAEATKTLTVKVAKKKTSVAASAKSVKASKRAKVSVTVKGANSGTVRVTRGGKNLTSKVKVSKSGKATITMPKLAKGKHKVTVSYAGTGNLKSSKKVITITVK